MAGASILLHMVSAGVGILNIASSLPCLMPCLGWLSDLRTGWHCSPWWLQGRGLFTPQLASLKVRIPRKSAQRDPDRNCKASYDLISEVPDYDFLTFN